MKDDLQRFVELRDKLTTEKLELERRLAEINQVLGSEQPASAVPAQAASAGRRGPGRPRGGKLQNPMSLREAVLQVNAGGPLTRQEIVEEVQKIGYRFKTKNPLNTLSSVIYGKHPKFRKDAEGRFAPVK